MKSILGKMRSLFENFDETSTGLPAYDILLNDADYGFKKGKIGEVINMSPDKYLEICVVGFTSIGGITTIEELIASRTDNALKNIENEMRKGTKMYLPVLDFSPNDFKQEGLHRTIAAKNLGYETIPVLLCVTTNREYASAPSPEELKKLLDSLKKELKL